MICEAFRARAQALGENGRRKQPMLHTVGDINPASPNRYIDIQTILPFFWGVGI